MHFPEISAPPHRPASKSHHSPASHGIFAMVPQVLPTPTANAEEGMNIGQAADASPEISRKVFVLMKPSLGAERVQIRVE
jgi:hypothetical protein